MLVRAGDEFGILYATDIKVSGFSASALLTSLATTCSKGMSITSFQERRTREAGFTSADPFEFEADHFAAGLLMPSTLFQAELRKVEDGLEKAIESLANECMASLTATAIGMPGLQGQPLQ